MSQITYVHMHVKASHYDSVNLTGRPLDGGGGRGGLKSGGLRLVLT